MLTRLGAELRWGQALELFLELQLAGGQNSGVQLLGWWARSCGRGSGGCPGDVSEAALGAGSGPPGGRWAENDIGEAMEAKHGQRCVGYRLLGVDVVAAPWSSS